MTFLRRERSDVNAAVGFRLRHFAQTPLEVSSLTVVGDERESAGIAAGGFSAKIEASQKIGARSVEQMIIFELGDKGDASSWASPCLGPWTMAMATARLSDTTG